MRTPRVKVVKSLIILCHRMLTKLNIWELTPSAMAAPAAARLPCGSCVRLAIRPAVPHPSTGTIDAACSTDSIRPAGLGVLKSESRGTLLETKSSRSTRGRGQIRSRRVQRSRRGGRRFKLSGRHVDQFIAIEHLCGLG